jgi:tRNA(fMet)-specific endonuclease VapC
VEAVLARVPILPLDVPTDAKYGEIRAELEVTDQSIGPNDLLTAAHASRSTGRNDSHGECR